MFGWKMVRPYWVMTSHHLLQLCSLSAVVGKYLTLLLLLLLFIVDGGGGDGGKFAGMIILVGLLPWIYVYLIT